jgi:hypothetical protein
VSDGEPFHNYEVEPPAPSYHAYVRMKDVNDAAKFASRLALDRARHAGRNPRTGIVTIKFDDHGASAKWTEE